MEATELSVEVRKKTGKEAAAKTRQTGGIPAILYGGVDTPPVALTVNDAALATLLRKSGDRLSLFTLSVKEDATERKETAIIKTIQRHPVNERIVHIDFLRVSMKKELTLEVPITMEGTPPGIKAGGVLQQAIRHVRVHCLPAAIPKSIVADVSKLEIGNVLAVRDLVPVSGVTVVTDPGQAVMSITVTRYEEEVVAETAEPGAEAVVAAPGAEAPAQPEVIGEKEREERRAKKDEDKGAREKEKVELKQVRAKEEKVKK